MAKCKGGAILSKVAIAIGSAQGIGKAMVNKLAQA